MDPLDLVTDPRLQAQILFALTVLSMVLPGLQWIADRTANTWDNALLARVSWLLSRIPRLKMGLGNTVQANVTVARASMKPPSVPAKPGDWLQPLVPLMSHAAAMSIAFGALTACAGSPTDTALQNRIEANALRDKVNEASDVLSQAHGALPFICAYLGEGSAACAALEDSYRVLASAVDTAHRGIDLLDAVGVGAEQTRVAAETVLSEAKAFGAAVQRSGEEVADAIEADRSDRGTGGPSAEQPAEVPAAQDAGPQPAAAP